MCVYVKVSSISKFILMYATVTCMNFYVCHIMFCVFMLDVVCVDYCIYKIFAIIILL